MTQEIDDVAAEAQKRARYVEGLKLWFEFMQLSNRKKWNDDVRKYIGPRAKETVDQWLKRCWPDMEPMREFPIVVHPEGEDVFIEHVEGIPEVHVSINLDFPKKDILDALKKLVNKRGPSKRGRPGKLRQRAFFQPNSYVNIPGLTNALKIYKADLKIQEDLRNNPGLKDDEKFKKATSNLGLGELVLGLESDGENNRSIEARVARYRARAKELVKAVENGKFPNVTKRANGEL